VGHLLGRDASDACRHVADAVHKLHLTELDECFGHWATTFAT
jgi:hypothetical protein